MPICCALIVSFKSSINYSSLILSHSSNISLIDSLLEPLPDSLFDLLSDSLINFLVDSLFDLLSDSSINFFS